MFAKDEFEGTLDYLGISLAELADLFQLNVRTVRRWAENPGEIPGAAEQALRAWVRLQRLGLAWRPDGIAIGERSSELAEQIKAHLRHAVDLDALIQRVNRRGGPKTPWKVDLKAHQATLGEVEVFFYALANGGFSPASYTRRDRPLDLQRDWPLIEDAFACVAEAVAKAGPAWAATEADSVSFAAGSTVPGQSAQQVLDKGERAFREALAAQGDLTAQEREAFEVGAQEIAVAVYGPSPEHAATESFLNLLMSANPGFRPDWPMWMDTRLFHDPRFAPRVKAKAWQALVVLTAGTMPWDMAEFYRLDPKGRFFLRRMIDDDTFARAQRFKVGQFLDPHHAIARTAEAIAVALAFARAMSFDSDQTTLAFDFRWTGLRDRIIHNWTGVGRFLPLRDQYRSVEDDAEGVIEVPLNVAESSLASYVEKATAGLFSQFGGFAPPVGFIHSVVQNLFEKG